MTRAGSWRGQLAAFSLYLVLSIACIDHGASITHRILGTSADPFIFMWFLAWWPYALSHHLNLLWTDLLWQPVGVAIPWVTSIPGIAVPLIPLTLLVGPVTTFNLVMIAAPALDAWAAYLLCRAITGRFAPAVIGGFFYGFSSYVMSQEATAMNLSLVICPPLLLLVIWARLNEQLSRSLTIAAATGLLILQFGISTEIAALMLFFGGMTWAFAVLYLPARRPALLSLVPDGLLVGLLFTLILSPVLIDMLETRGVLHLPEIWKFFFTADLLRVIVPTPETLWGSLWPIIPKRFPSELNELDAYLGLPLLGIIYVFARNAPHYRWLVMVFLALLFASFGPFLWIGGWFSNIAMPWFVFTFLPLLKDALPARFALFVALATAVIVALWLSEGPPKRYLWAALAMIFLTPALHPIQSVPNSVFFSPRHLSAALGPNPKVMIFPFSVKGPSSYWQLEDGFGFRQTGGYVGFPPATMQHFDGVDQSFGGQMEPHFAADLTRFVQATGTQFIVIGQGTPSPVRALLRSLDFPSRQVDDVTVLTVQPAR
jgi:hypothetical protein